MTQSKRPPSVVSLMIIVGGLAGVTPLAGAARAACASAAITCNGASRKTGDGDIGKPVGEPAHTPGNEAAFQCNGARSRAADAAGAKGENAGFFCNMRPAAGARARARARAKGENAGFYCNMRPTDGKSAAAKGENAGFFCNMRPANAKTAAGAASGGN